jgi:hypothetical protein
MDEDLRQGRFRIAPRHGDENVYTEELGTFENGNEIPIPHGQVQHWLGATFVRGATLAQARAVMQDYNNYQNIYKPDVLASKLLRRRGDEFEVFLRLYKKQVITVVFNTDYRIRYFSPDPKRFYIRSYATRIAEARDSSHPDAGERAPGDDHGFLWRLNSYWRFQEADGGVYVECEAVSLSRDVPALLAAAVSYFIKRFPSESLRNTLNATRKAILDRASVDRPSVGSARRGEAVPVAPLRAMAFVASPNAPASLTELPPR